MRRLLLLLAVVVAALLLADPAAFADKATEAGSVLEEAPSGETKGWDEITRSIAQFGHGGFLLRLAIGLSLAVACAWVIAWHPRRSTKVDPLSDLEERKALILLGLVGAIAAELGVNQNMAFVIFGIGALIRFRTVLDNPKVTGKAIMVVVIGLACGMGHWAMAAFVTAAAWGLIFWLDSHLSARIRIRVTSKLDLRNIYAEVQDFLHRNHCRIKSASIYEQKRQLVFLTHIPSDLDPIELETSLKAKLPKSAEGCDVDIRVG